MSRFAQIFFKLLEEDNFAGAGGALGNAPSMGHGGDVPGGSDFYARGDSRVPKLLGTFKRSGLIKRKKRRKKR